MKSLIKPFKVLKVLSLLSILLITSCASRQDLVYFQDEAITSAIENQNSNFGLTYQTNDLLTINVSLSATNQDATKPYNLPLISSGSLDNGAQGNLAMQTYLVDNQGNIEYPGLGLVKIGGLTNQEATKLLKEKLSDYLVNPIVTIRLTNFTVSVLGEVKNAGAYTVTDERISLAEALGLAGDLTIYGNRKNVLLIREVNGEKKYHKFDLTSVNVLNSSNYYLRQNDVIYVEPNNARVRSASYNQNNGIIISAVGTLATIVAILIK